MAKAKRKIHAAATIDGRKYESQVMDVPDFMSDESALEWAFSGVKQDFKNKNHIKPHEPKRHD